jgi:methylenetetrahydrofolate dehydrogenase (NADP+)/methenyltetrahydrofolate cyclohydrolase
MRMSAVILDGKQLAQTIREELKERVLQLRRQGVVPRLGVILVGEDPASHSYVKAKGKACADLSIEFALEQLGQHISQREIMTIIDRWNNDPSTHGILVQLPLPEQIDAQRVIEALDPSKDVDGFHPVNLGRLVSGVSGFVPATPSGIVEMLLRSGNEPAGKDVVIVGRSTIVGKPLANLLLMRGHGGNATVTICHSKSRDLFEHTARAEILVVAVGSPELITGDKIRPGACVIDVGVNRVADSTKKRGYRLVGDVHFATASEVAGAITPVPGGVGPMTITMLLKNTVAAAQATVRDG